MKVLQPEEYVSASSQGHGYRYVAMCDVLGFSNLSRGRSLDDLVQMYQALLARFSNDRSWSKFVIAQGKETLLIPNLVSGTVFSDTLLLWVDADRGSSQLDAIQQFFGCLCRLISGACSMKIPLRVGVAYGECYMDTRQGIYVGPPIVYAHEVEEAQVWVGGACHETCEGAPFFFAMEDSGFVCEHDIEVKSGCSIGNLRRAIDWADCCDSEGIEWLREQARNLQDPRIRRKYELALDFLQCAHSEEHCCSEDRRKR